MVVEGSTLYMTFEDQQLYTYTLGQEEPVLLAAFNHPFTEKAFLFTWQEKLYLFDPEVQKAYQVDKATGQVNEDEAMNLPLPLEDENGNDVNLSSQGVYDDKLFIIQMAYQARGAVKTLYSINLSTSEITAYQSENINRLIPYKNGQIAALTYVAPNGSAGGEAKVQISLATFDPETDALTQLAVLEDIAPAGLAYNEKEDAFYFTQEKKLYRMGSDFIPLNVDYLASSWGALENQGWITEDKMYILFSSFPGLVEIKNADEQYKPAKELVVDGNIQPRVISAYNEKYPDIPVVKSDPKGESPYSMAEELVQAMLTGALKADVIMIDLLNMPFWKIMEKEYALPLSSSQLI